MDDQFSFTFETDEESEIYCRKIVQELIEIFGIDHDEAVGRVNLAFAGRPILGENDWIYHELPDYWAKTIYYPTGTYWWIGEEGLEPRSYP